MGPQPSDFEDIFLDTVKDYLISSLPDFGTERRNVKNRTDS